MNILLTGATGFVGNSLLLRLKNGDKNYNLSVVLRKLIAISPDMANRLLVDSLSNTTKWGTLLKGANVVIHCAARVHVMQDNSTDPLNEYRLVNVAGTLNLARQAAESGVKRFIFLSSIKVNGEQTDAGQAFTVDGATSPSDPYGISKLEAEQGLREIAATTGMELVIIRPPLVYGPGVKANFEKMVQWLSKGVPLPLANIQNKRSMVAIDNLVDLIVTCIDHPAAANQTFMVSDGDDLSTSDLLRRMAAALEPYTGKDARLFYVPPALLTIGAKLVGKPDMAQRLCASLQVDISKTRKILGWKPPISVDEGLRRVAVGFAHTHDLSKK